MVKPDVLLISTFTPHPPPDAPLVFWLTVWSGAICNYLTRLESWSNDWQLKFNTDKCEVMHISKKNDYSSPQYHLCGNQLKAVSEVKDLGIYITSNLSWSMQANKCANKANSVLGFIRRTVGPKNPQLFSKLYNSLVCPILEYCSPIWCPHLKKDSNTLEKVQRRATKCALGNIGRDMSYEKRGLFSSLTECYKTINRLNGLDPSIFYVCTWFSALKS